MARNRVRLDAKELKEQTDAREVARSLPELKLHAKSGRYDVYFSPSRNERNASFHVYADGYHDFATRESGDVIQLLRVVRGNSFHEALEWLYEFNGGQPELQRSPKPRHSAPKDRRPKFPQEIIQQELNNAQDFLWSDARHATQARSYLHEKRGLTDATIRAFGLGLVRRNKTIQWIDEVDEETWTAELPFGIVIPWYEDGQLVALRVRRPVGDLAEYLNVDVRTDIPKYQFLMGSAIAGKLFGANSLSNVEDVLIVEGEFDLMVASQQLGDQIAVVTLGSASNRLNGHWVEQLRQKHRIFSLFDNDAAGQKAVQELDTLFGDKHHALTVPQGQDITEYIVDYGGDLRSLIPSQDPRVWWPNGLPDSFREAILNYLSKSMISAIELINQAINNNLIDPTRFTVPDLVRASTKLGYAFKRRNLYNLLDEARGIFVHELTSVYCHGVNSCTSPSSLSGNSDSKTYQILPVNTIRQGILNHAYPRIYEAAHIDKEGRPIPARWTKQMTASIGVDPDNGDEAHELINSVFIEPLLENSTDDPEVKARNAVEALKRELDKDRSKPLPQGWPIHNGTKYRATWARAIVQTEGETPRTNATWMKRLGVKTHNTVKTTLSNAGLENEAQFVTVKLEVTTRRVHEIEMAINKLGRNRIQSFTILEPDRSPIEVAPGERAPEILAEYMGPRTKIYCTVQTASKARIAADEPIKRPRSKNKSSKGSPKPIRQTTDTKASRLPDFVGTDYDPAFLTTQLHLIVRNLSSREHKSLQTFLPQNKKVCQPSHQELFLALLQLAEVKSRPILATALEFGATIRRTGRAHTSWTQMRKRFPPSEERKRFPPTKEKKGARVGAR